MRDPSERTHNIPDSHERNSRLAVIAELSSTSAGRRYNLPGVKLARESHRSRVLLVEDHPILAAGLGAVLERKGFQVVGVATTVVDALALVREKPADVAIIDIELGDGSGLEFIRTVRGDGPACVVFSAHAEAMYVHESVRAGAIGYVVKSAPVALLVEAVKSVSRLVPYFCPKAMKAFQGSVSPESIRDLTERETEVLKHVARGLTNKKIAELLGISSRTVESHRERIQSKLGVHTAASLTHVAIAMGLVRVGDP